MTSIDIIRFVEWAGAILSIAPPSVSFDSSFFPTPTTLAMLSNDGKRLHLRKREFDFDMCFCVLHEMRHKWQFESNPKLFYDYQSSAALSSDAYNLQPAELDANAFARRIMVDYFGIEPLFNGLGDNVKQKIKALSEELQIY